MTECWSCIFILWSWSLSLFLVRVSGSKGIGIQILQSLFLGSAEKHLSWRASVCSHHVMPCSNGMSEIFSGLVAANNQRLKVFTAASAKPFDSGLYGKDNSREMLLALQYSANSDLNWGPSSDLIELGYSYSRKRFTRLSKSDAVVVFGSWDNSSFLANNTVVWL